MQHYFSSSIRTAVQYDMVIIASAAAPPLLYAVAAGARFPDGLLHHPHQIHVPHAAAPPVPARLLLHGRRQRG